MGIKFWVVLHQPLREKFDDDSATDDSAWSSHWPDRSSPDHQAGRQKGFDVSLTAMLVDGGQRVCDGVFPE